jgi:RNA polymerase sigma-70 factor (ECF subfamily)
VQPITIASVIRTGRIVFSKGATVWRLGHRAVVVLHFYSGFSAAEIARMLCIPEGTARSRLHYATEAMRAALQADARQPAVAQNRTA